MIESISKYEIPKYKSFLSDFSFDEESLAYGWTINNVRFIQLHLNATYTASFYTRIIPYLIWRESKHINSAIPFLKKDMENHPDLPYIINMHKADGIDALKPFLSRIALIFVGHSHYAGKKCWKFNDNTRIPYFDSGALFKGNFFLTNLRKENENNATICYKVQQMQVDEEEPFAEYKKCIRNIYDDQCGIYFKGKK